MTEYVALTLKDRTVNSVKIKQGTMVRADEGTLLVSVSLVGSSKDAYAVFASRVGDDGFLTDLGRVGTVRKERIGVYHVSTFRPDGTPSFDGHADNFTLSSAVENVVGTFLSNAAYAEKVERQAEVAADPTHVHEFNQFNVCDACGARQVSKKEQVQTLRLEALPYTANAASSLVFSRGEKCALTCQGRVGFYFPSEVGDILMSLVEVGLDVTVHAPTTVEIN